MALWARLDRPWLRAALKREVVLGGAVIVVRALSQG